MPTMVFHRRGTAVRNKGADAVPHFGLCQIDDGTWRLDKAFQHIGTFSSSVKVEEPVQREKVLKAWPHCE
ncbi:hypothetical protein ACO0K7_05010 [Undibacterium sp. Ji67W]|uniref:hypothetical protein n=1 Tax=Undibacterium sp. Ji67W TaxID=3413042 RepID=UPI003BF042C4